jgi:outer membrane immunogenic protein
MKILVRLSVAAFGATLTISATAADLHPRKSGPVRAPEAPVWTGLYAGLNAGGVWGGNTQFRVDGSYAGSQYPSLGAAYTGNMSALGTTQSVGAGIGGFIGGGQLGYNDQLTERIILGVEIDIQGISGASNGGLSASIVPLMGSYYPSFYDRGELFGTVVNASKRINYLGSIRGRVGFLPRSDLLVYLTGGLSYGGVSMRASALQGNNDLEYSGGNQYVALYSPAWSSGYYSSDVTGWTAGGGVEWMISRNWSIKGEYFYYDLGPRSFSMTPLVTTVGDYPGIWSLVNMRASTRFNNNVFRAGINYHFNWSTAPVVASY